MVMFIDDVFVLDLNWLRDFVPKYKKLIGLPFNCDAHPAGVTRELVSLLKDAGCDLLIFGVQSASERVRRDILKRPETNDQILKATRICREFNLNFTIDHILNIPGDTNGELREAICFYNLIRPTIINTFLLTYYPLTLIVETAVKAKLLTAKDVRAINEGKTPTTYSLSLGGRRETVRNKNQKNLDQYIFWLNALPLFPQGVVNFMNDHGYMNKNFHPPVWLIVLVKFLIRLRIGRPFDTIYTINLLFKRMIIVLKLRYLMIPKQKYWLTDPIK